MNTFIDACLDECELSIDRRYLPGEEVRDLLEEFIKLFREIKKKDLQFEAKVYARSCVERSYTGYKKKVQKYHPPWIIEEDHIFVRKTLSALKKVDQNPDIGNLEQIVACQQH